MSNQIKYYYLNLFDYFKYLFNFNLFICLIILNSFFYFHISKFLLVGLIIRMKTCLIKSNIFVQICLIILKLCSSLTYLFVWLFLTNLKFCSNLICIIFNEFEILFKFNSRMNFLWSFKIWNIKCYWNLVWLVDKQLEY